MPMATDPYNATVTHRLEIAPGLIVLRIVPDDPLFRFEAGQYTVLGLARREPRIVGEDETDPQSDPERLIKRAYSIASSSRPGEHVEFYITLVSSGELTPRLFGLGEGGRLFLGKKGTGVFTLARVPEGYHVLLVATGTGLAPYISMLRSELVCGGPRRFVVLHGARYSWDLGYRTELNILSQQCSNLTCLSVVSRAREDPSWNGLTGYLQDVLFSGVVEEKSGIPLSPDAVHVFLCGNPGMITAAKEGLIARGFTPDKGRVIGDVHIEEYW
jgi:ferredoxin/flavodoxin---NADP+ reductase